MPYPLGKGHCFTISPAAWDGIPGWRKRYQLPESAVQGIEGRDEFYAEGVVFVAGIALHVQPGISEFDQLAAVEPESGAGFEISQFGREVSGAITGGILDGAGGEPAGAAGKIEPRADDGLQFSISGGDGGRDSERRFGEAEVLPLGIDAETSARPLAVDAEALGGKAAK